MSEPDNPQVTAAFESLREDASEVDAMAALHRSEGHRRRNVRLAVLGSLAAAALVVIGVRVWVGPSQQGTSFVAAGRSSETLEGTSWGLVEGSGPEGGIELVEGAPITLNFDDGGIVGHGGCNDYGAFLEFEDDLRFSTTDLYWNASECERSVNNAEAAFFAALLDADFLSVSGDELTLSGPATTLTFRSAPPEAEGPVLSAAALKGTAWVLVSGGDVPIVDGWPITLTFGGENLGGTAACNGYGSSFEISGTSIQLDEIGKEDAGCEEAVLASEAAFLSALQTVEALRLDGDELVLLGEEVQLVFQPDASVPSAELVGRLWLLTGLIQGDNTTQPIGQPATLRLNTDGSLEGSTGCRTLAGEYRFFGSSVNFGTFGAEGDCLGSELSSQDGLVVTVLEGGFTAEIDGDVLTLTAEGNEGLEYVSIEGAPEPEVDQLTIADLAGTRWTFIEGVGPASSVLQALEGFPISLRIAVDALRGNGPCTDYFMPLDPDPARFSAGGVESDAVDCEASGLQDAYNNALEDITSFSVSGEFLTLHGPSTELNFQNDSNP